MLGPLFTINRDNVVRAAMAEVMKDLTLDDPVELTARPHENGIDALILVTGSDGSSHELIVRESTIAECLRKEDFRVAAQQLVDQLVAEIKLAVDKALR